MRQLVMGALFLVGFVASTMGVAMLGKGVSEYQLAQKMRDRNQAGNLMAQVAHELGLERGVVTLTLFRKNITVEERANLQLPAIRESFNGYLLEALSLSESAAPAAVKPLKQLEDTVCRVRERVDQELSKPFQVRSLAAMDSLMPDVDGIFAAALRANETLATQRQHNDFLINFLDQLRYSLVQYRLARGLEAVRFSTMMIGATKPTEKEISILYARRSISNAAWSQLRQLAGAARSKKLDQLMDETQK
ncbi:MAG: hypothetical protein MO853_14210 [Candidatus Protistobacter heckmanni]|nr:hypothetical protein [Candidatus Protistobacter heckmanni]